MGKAASKDPDHDKAQKNEQKRKKVEKSTEDEHSQQVNSSVYKYLLSSSLYYTCQGLFKRCFALPWK